jgi:fumarate reductase (CoM/CoB) subunit B
MIMDYNTQASDCIRCGQCRKHCEFLNSYGINLSDTKRLKELAYHCFMCGKCKIVCPKNIDGKDMVLKMRRQKVTENRGKFAEKGYGLLLKEKKNYLFRNYRHTAGKSVLFPGCNFPSFYPQTTKKLAELLKEKAGIGVVFDCCGKPISELGLKEEEEAIIGRLNQKMEQNGIEEMVVVCPNCYYYLKPRLQVSVVSIYEKLQEMGLGDAIDVSEINIFSPCPDRETLALQKQMEPFLQKQVNQIKEVQCCGLGGCAGVKEPELARKLPNTLQEKNYSNIYTYCASCSGNLAKAGCENVHHVLVDILKSEEKPDVKNSLLNRAKTKFY